MIPMMTTIVLNTSDAEWMASLIMALECATVPARNLRADNMVFPSMVIMATLFAVTLASFMSISFQDVGRRASCRILYAKGRRGFVA